MGYLLNPDRNTELPLPSYRPFSGTTVPGLACVRTIPLKELCQSVPGVAAVEPFRSWELAWPSEDRARRQSRLHPLVTLNVGSGTGGWGGGRGTRRIAPVCLPGALWAARVPRPPHHGGISILECP